MTKEEFDKLDYQTFLKREKKRSVITSIVLASAITMSVLFLTFAIMQRNEAEQNYAEFYDAETKLKQLELQTYAKLQELERQLKDCQNQ